MAETSADSAGCEVVPAIDAQAASTASTPASIAASRVASWPPAVSWVCRCTGRSKRSRSAVTRVRAAGRAQQPGHVLDRQHVRAGLDDPLGQAEVVVERVELLGGAGQVAGVAERDLGDGRAGLAHRLDRRPHLLDVVERVEDPEHVEPGRRRPRARTPWSPRSGTACSRPCCGRGAASAGRCWAPPGAARPAAPTGPRRGSAARRRTSRRPSTPGTTARAWSGRRGRPPAAGRGCGPGSRAATGGRRGTSCP